jgi:hypothetical protein
VAKPEAVTSSGTGKPAPAESSAAARTGAEDTDRAAPAQAGEKARSAVDTVKAAPSRAGEKVKAAVPDNAADKAGQAQQAGRQAKDSAPMRYLARAGFVALAVEYVIIGVIAVQAAFGDTGQQADKSGVLQTLGKNPAGEVALWLLAIGFFGMAVWRLAQAAFGSAETDDEDNKKETWRRLAAVGKGVVYAVLGYSTLKYAVGGGSQSSDSESVDATSTLMAHPGGRFLVAAVGVALVAGGVFLAYSAWRERFRKNLQLEQVPPRFQRIVTWLGKYGGIARGAVFVTAGVFLVVAAVTAQPGQAKGLDSSLRSLAGTPAGPWLLVIVAVGLVMFGLFCACEAKWRRV